MMSCQQNGSGSGGGGIYQEIMLLVEGACEGR